jgi:hypothetical protein
MQNQGTETRDECERINSDQCEQLARACEEAAVGFRQMAAEADKVTHDDWKIVCESLREMMNIATGELVRAALRHSRATAAAAAANG